MKGTLEYNLLDEGEKEAFRCAQKGDDMSWVIDSFLDYLSVCFPENMLKKATGQAIYDRIYDMYREKMTQADIWDMVDEDIQHLREEGYPSVDYDLALIMEMAGNKRHENNDKKVNKKKAK